MSDSSLPTILQRASQLGVPLALPLPDNRRLALEPARAEMLETGQFDSWDGAVEFYQQTGRAELMLETMSSCAEVESYLKRCWLGPTWKLSLVLLVTPLVLWFFLLLVKPEIEALRADLFSSPYPDAVEPGVHWIDWLDHLARAIAAFSLLALLTLGLGGRKWLMGTLGGNSLRHATRLQSAAQLVEALLEQGHSLEESIPLANRAIAGNEATMELLNQSFTAVRAPQQSLAATPVGFFATVASRYQQASQMLPYLMVYLVGGVIVSVSMATMFGSVVQLLYKLVLTEIPS